jgi:hypothetical protein
MRAPHPCLAVVAGATAVALLLAGCTASRPVHPEVSWDGQHSGPFEDDPRVQALRQALTQVYAAANALNYSEPDLLAVASTDWLESEMRIAATDISVGQMQLWEGPPAFTVTDIIQSETRPETYGISVCERPAAWLSRSDHWSDPVATPRMLDKPLYTVTEQSDGVFRVEKNLYAEGGYTITEQDGQWLVEGGGSDIVECDPGPDVVTGTFTTPPDPDLLREAETDMVIGPDGRQYRGRS